MRGDKGEKCHVFFTNGKQCGNNTVHCTARELLFCDEMRETGYSVLHIIAGRSPKTGADDTICLFTQNVSSLAPVYLWGK